MIRSAKNFLRMTLFLLSSLAISHSASATQSELLVSQTGTHTAKAKGSFSTLKESIDIMLTLPATERRGALQAFLAKADSYRLAYLLNNYAMSSREQLDVLSKWAELNAAEASNYALELADTRPSFLSNTLATWSESNPVAVADWMDAQDLQSLKLEFKEQLYADNVGQIAREDLPLAMERWKNIRSHKAALRTVEIMVIELNKISHTVAEYWLANFTEFEVQRHGQQILAKLAKEDTRFNWS